jgi:hypothetical protein
LTSFGLGPGDAPPLPKDTDGTIVTTDAMPEAGEVGDGDVGGADAAADREVDALLDGGDADARTFTLCDPTDNTLVACFAFENNATNQGTGPQPSTMTGLTYVQGVRGQAVALTSSSYIQLPSDAKWNATTATIEAWVKPTSLPGSGQRMGIMDSESRWGLFLIDNARVQCTLGGGLSGGTITAGVWTHIACVNNGAQQILYVNGVSVAMQTAGGIGSSSNPTNVGSNSPSGGDYFIGAIDELRFFSSARSPAEIAEAALP